MNEKAIGCRSPGVSGSSMLLGQTYDMKTGRVIVRTPTMKQSQHAPIPAASPQATELKVRVTTSNETELSYRWRNRALLRLRTVSQNKVNFRAGQRLAAAIG
jgi:hypothetical protein